MDLSCRIRPSEVAQITSLSLRQVQALAVSGKIPGAAKLGGCWTFDERKLHDWIRAAEREACRNPVISTRGGIPTGGASVLPDVSTDALYERLIKGKRPSGSKRGGSTLSARL